MSTTIFRYFPREVIKTATIKHLPTNDGVRNYPGSSEETVLGALVRISRYQRAMLGGDMRMKFMLFVADTTVIREADTVTISGTQYKVSDVDLYDYGSTKHKAAILSTT